MNTKTKRLLVLLELENGDVHQVILSKTQETAIKSILQSLPDNVQVLSTPLDLKIERQGEKDNE